MVLKKNKCERIKIYCRLKPIVPELTPINYILSKRNKNGTLTINLNNNYIKPENSKYKFHDVFPSTSSQSMVFEKVASPMIDKFVLKGVNCTIFSYGQTGSGKTYTICGSKQIKDRGIIHQTFDRLFNLVQTYSSGKEYEVNVSFIEIHKNIIQDLTITKESKNKTEPYKTRVTNKADAIKLFEQIKLRRKTSATNRNEHSSRSHFICTIYLRKKDQQSFDAQFKLVDLAGSEDYSSIESNASNQIETLAIKKSLYSLKNITRILANPCFKGNIPYRDSKLTYELRSTLEGKCRVAMIANVDSNDQCIKELVNTFEYAREIASIKKCPISTNKHAPSLEMDETRLLVAENENLKSELLSFKTKFENLTEENALLKKQNDLFNRKDHEGGIKCIIASGDTCTTNERSGKQRRRRIWTPESTLQVVEAEPSTKGKDKRNAATKSSRVSHKLGFMKGCLDRAMFGDKCETAGAGPSRRPCNAMVFEDDGDECGDSRETRGWWPYGRDCYHKARCCVRSGESSDACCLCELGLKPEREPATGGGVFYHYLACQQKLTGRPCAHDGGAKRVNLYVAEAAETDDVRRSVGRDAVGPDAVGLDAADRREWLPYGRDCYHEVRCDRPAADRGGGAAACPLCDFGHARRRAEDDGGSRYVHYVWCPNKMTGRPCCRDDDSDREAVVSEAVSVASSYAATETCPVDPAVVRRSSAVRAVPSTVSSDYSKPVLSRPSANSKPVPARPSLYSKQVPARPSLYSKQVPARPSLYSKQVPARPLADSKVRPQPKRFERPRAVSAARPGVAKKTRQTVDALELDDYFEALLKSMEVPKLLDESFG